MLTPTDQQIAVIEANRQGGTMVVTAGAGTGKTTTLKMCADTTPGRVKEDLYLAYNKGLQLEAEAKFPPHVDCRTAHSLAYRAVGHRYRARLRAPSQPGRHTAEILGITRPVELAQGVVLHTATIARLAGDTVKRFCLSPDRTITEQHVPHVDGLGDTEMRDLRALVHPYAVKAWDNLQTDDATGGFNPKTPATYRGHIRMTHDVYLKMWSLTDPTLRYRRIYYDECQDADPVISAVVKAQTNTPVILVGDPNQQLYRWRGAVDVMSDWPADTRLVLSQSFRFGPEIATEANKWLELGGSALRLTGLPGHPSRVGPLTSWPDVVLCRTNAEAVRQVISGLRADRRVALAGGGKEIKALADACLMLKDGRRTTHPELCVFNTWGEVQDYAEHDDDSSLGTFVKLIDQIGAEVITTAMDRVIDQRDAKAGNRCADLTISTGHRSKGLEWNRVRIGDDFTEPKTKDGEQLPVTKDATMLHYVVVTRARDHLDRAGLDYVDTRLADHRQAGV